MTAPERPAPCAHPPDPPDPPDPLGPRVRALFEELAHAGDVHGIQGRVLTGQAGRSGEGTQVRFGLLLSAGRVQQVRYRAYGCPFTLATCEWLARRLTGQSVAEGAAGVGLRTALRAAVGGPADWSQALGIPAPRLGRLLVIEDALLACCAAASAAGGPDSALTNR